MFQVTEEATALVKEARSRSGVPEEAGLRIQVEKVEGPKRIVKLRFQSEPGPADLTIEMSELRVFVSPELVEPLSNRVLDVSTDHGSRELTFR